MELALLAALNGFAPLAIKSSCILCLKTCIGILLLVGNFAHIISGLNFKSLQWNQIEFVHRDNITFLPSCYCCWWSHTENTMDILPALFLAITTPRLVNDWYSLYTAILHVLSLWPHAREGWYIHHCAYKFVLDGSLAICARHH